jgi:hypothetical protein
MSAKKLLLGLSIAVMDACGGGHDVSETGMNMSLSVPQMERIVDWQERESAIEDHLPESIDGTLGSTDSVKALLVDLLYNKGIHYIDEKVAYWQTSDETAALGGGDCEDLAIWAYRAIRESQKISDARVSMLWLRWMVETDEQNHVILQIICDDGVLYVDNLSVFSVFRYPDDSIVAEFDLWSIAD